MAGCFATRRCLQAYLIEVDTRLGDGEVIPKRREVQDRSIDRGECQKVVELTRVGILPSHRPSRRDVQTDEARATTRLNAEAKPTHEAAQVGGDGPRSRRDECALGISKFQPGY